MTHAAPQRNRASFAQATLREVEALDPVVRDRILARMSPASVAEIRGALSVQWLPPEPYYDLLEAVRAELGDPDTRNLCRRLMNRYFENPLLRAVVDSFLRRVGFSPQSLLRFVPHGRQLVADNAGRLIYEPLAEERGMLRLRGFPTTHFRSGTAVELLLGCWEAALDFSGVEGHVEVQGLDLDKGACDFVLTWKARG
ncbi:hypothetical protein [Polyangium sorediatum]|uniref:Heme NO-binding domain-containing protein n=1 Tax=Polyangium sorediatum TaxID=889274 RepID=A0ABT6PAA5_9BACT|nr:hypothetical protein [Polyangium sorediatum]MDI1437562.1 hypothetical protein [Polyangium sorediatum]